MFLSDFLALVGLIISSLVFISFVREERKKPVSASDYFYPVTGNQPANSALHLLRQAPPLRRF